MIEKLEQKFNHKAESYFFKHYWGKSEIMSAMWRGSQKLFKTNQKVEVTSWTNPQIAHKSIVILK